MVYGYVAANFFFSGYFYFFFVSTSLAYITKPKHKRQRKIPWDKKLTTGCTTGMWLVMVGGHTWISFSCRHYFDLSRNPRQRTSAEIRVVQNVKTIITAHSKPWKKNCPIHFPNFKVESFFIEKYIYYEKSEQFP